jgi:general stress protein CsbA
MHPGLVGGIVGSVVGGAGGLLGAYLSIKNTKGPRERAFVIMATIGCGVFVAGFVVGMYLLATPYKYWLVGVYAVGLVAGILACNRRQVQIRAQESDTGAFPVRKEESDAG